MKNLFASMTLLFAAAALFAAGVITKSDARNLAAPTSLSVLEEPQFASGPTIPPIDEDDTGAGGTNVASGPTIPPIDDDDTGAGGTNVASGPTIPPIDDDDTGAGGTNLTAV